MRFVLNRSALRLRVALYPKVIFFSSSVIPTNNGCFVARYTAPRLHHPRLPPPQTSSSASSTTFLSCSCLVLDCFAFWLMANVTAVHDDFLLLFRGLISPPVSAHASLVLVVTVTPAAFISCTNALAAAKGGVCKGGFSKLLFLLFFARFLKAMAPQTLPKDAPSA